jgi:putative nucleotidyltransferase with HDIG domain
MIGRCIYGLLPPELARLRRQVIESVIASGQAANHEDQHGDLWLESAVYPIFGPEGRVERLAVVARDITERRQAEQMRSEHADRLRRTVDGAVLAMGSAVEMRDPYTAGHERRVTRLAEAIGRELGLEDERLDGLRLAGSVHDIGKIAVPAEILSKPGKLHDYEFSLVQGHSQVGADILRAIEFDQPVADIVWQHHERQDGSGYPRGLRGEEILLEARILAVADVVEAMASHRPYRPSLGIGAALDQVRDGAGSRYDADVVAVCERVVAGGFSLEDES